MISKLSVRRPDLATWYGHGDALTGENFLKKKTHHYSTYAWQLPWSLRHAFPLKLGTFPLSTCPFSSAMHACSSLGYSSGAESVLFELEQEFVVPFTVVQQGRDGSFCSSQQLSFLQFSFSHFCTLYGSKRIKLSSFSLDP